jgi:hypothetical protein
MNQLMENLGTYFLIALAIAFVIYYSNKKKTSTPKAKAPAKPRAAAASKPGSKKPNPKKGRKGPKKEEKATGASPVLGAGMGATTRKQSGLSFNQSELDLIAELSLDPEDRGAAKSQEPSKAPKATPAASPQFDLEKEVKQLQARTGWDYANAKGYCEQVIQYHQKIAAPSRLKKS